MIMEMESPQIGDKCPRCCGGVLGVYCTRILTESRVRVRYFCCRKCKCRPENNQQVIPLRYSPARGNVEVRKK